MTSLFSKMCPFFLITILVLTSCTHRGIIALRGQSETNSEISDKCPDISGTYYDIASEVLHEMFPRIESSYFEKDACEMHLLPNGKYMSYSHYWCSLDSVLDSRLYVTSTGEIRDYMSSSKVNWKVVIQQQGDGTIIAIVLDGDKYFRKHTLKRKDYWCNGKAIFVGYGNLLFARTHYSFSLANDRSLTYTEVDSSFIAGIPYTPIIFPIYVYDEKRFKWERTEVDIDLQTLIPPSTQTNGQKFIEDERWKDIKERGMPKVDLSKKELYKCRERGISLNDCFWK